MPDSILILPNAKHCSQCKEYKSLDDFDKAKLGKYKKFAKCKACRAKNYIEKVQDDPAFRERKNSNSRKAYRTDSYRNGRLKEYGITADDYDRMYITQEGSCKLCRKHQSEELKSLAVDHCHTSGKVRGLLCNKCNQGLGYFNDDIRLFEKAIEYLKNA